MFKTRKQMVTDMLRKITNGLFAFAIVAIFELLMMFFAIVF